ncbi:MFS family permease [Pseudonocardia eucalypti]|nr:MFS family permease [Pseudonocardia eucalypti]
MLLDSRNGLLRRRLWPLWLGGFLQSVGFWVPVEKLFETEIGFDAADIGFVSAAYAAVVPLLEVPSGVLADRWSRRGVLLLATGALTVSALLGGLATDVPGYLLSALALGGFFAMYSGTTEAAVYDAVREETGSGERFEREMGRIRLAESLGLVSSALAGGWLASALDTRATYFLTIPFGIAAMVVYLRFREPRLHKTGAEVPLSAHLVIGYRSLHRRLLPVVTLAVLTALLVQVLLEFGPLWLVALAVPAVWYGPYWAGLTSTLGLGGLLAGRLRLHRPVAAATTAAAMAGAGAVLALPVGPVPAVAAQTALALLVVVTGIHVNRLLHDAVPSRVRAGVASAVSTVSWLVFVPFAVVIGLVGTGGGVVAAGGLVAGSAALAGGLLIWLAVSRRGG